MPQHGLKARKGRVPGSWSEAQAVTLVWLRQNRQWSRAPTPAHSLWRLQRHSVEQLRPTKPKWHRQWSGSTHEPFTQPWAQTGRHSPVVLRGWGGVRAGRWTSPPHSILFLLCSSTFPTLGASPQPLFWGGPSNSPPCHSRTWPSGHMSPRSTPPPSRRGLCFLLSCSGPCLILILHCSPQTPPIRVCPVPLPQPTQTPVWLQPHLSMV